MVDQTETAKEREYRELLEFLFEQHVRPRLPEIREHAAEFGRLERRGFRVSFSPIADRTPTSIERSTCST
jgi:hypothetical protein